MRTTTASIRGPFVGVALLAAFLVVIGVVMAESHVPVAIEPDAARPAGVEVATFALG